MSMAANQSDKWQFTVKQLQMTHPITGQKIPNLYGNFREDTGACLGTTTEQYGIIQNEELLAAAHEALDTRGLSGWNERILVTQDGKRFYADFTFANKQLASEVGDVFGYKLILKNSFDRSTRASFQLGMLRLTCKNGASTLEKDMAATAKHSVGISVKFVGQAIDRALAQGQNALKVYDQMAGISLTDEQGVNVLNQLVLAKDLSGSLRDDIKIIWLNPRRDEDKARNLYNLYNAVTEHLTHKVSSERYEYADALSSGILFRFANAARKPDKLAKLILPVPVEGVTIDVQSEAVEPLEPGTTDIQLGQ